MSDQNTQGTPCPRCGLDHDSEAGAQADRIAQFVDETRERAKSLGLEPWQLYLGLGHLQIGIGREVGKQDVRDHYEREPDDTDDAVLVNLGHQAARLLGVIFDELARPVQLVAVGELMRTVSRDQADADQQRNLGLQLAQRLQGLDGKVILLRDDPGGGDAPSDPVVH